MHTRVVLALPILLAFTACQSSTTKETAQASTAAPSGPVEGTRLTEAYVRLVARDAYFWAWPMVNIYNRRLAFARAPAPGLMGGILPFAPLNRLSMLSDYVEPAERDVACPNQDVVYGGGVLALDQSPVVVQVPDFGKRFWVYQVVDMRTDSFADLGAMYGTKPGFYLLAGPDWKGTVPNGITGVFYSKTQTGFVIPRVFQDDIPADKHAVQSVISGIDVYPLSMFDGKVKTVNYQQLPKFPSQSKGNREARWVFPDKFFDELPEVLKQAPPLSGEQARYTEVLAVIGAAQKDPYLKKAMVDSATRAEEELIDPLLQFRSFGIPLPYNWTTINNGAAFGTDYFTRTAVGKSNIFVNKPNETKYFYQDLDNSGTRLNGSKQYTVTFAAGQVPPVKGFWSLTLYNENHFFEPNTINRYSVGTKNKDLKVNADGSLTIYVQSGEPSDIVQRANWLPSPKGGDFSLYVRSYWPEAAITSGQWTPPAVKINR